MKTLKLSLFVVLLAVIMVGCGVDKILPKKDGVWTTTNVTYRSYVNSSLDSTWVDPLTYTYTFDKSGSATVFNGTGTETLTWSVNPDGDIVILCYATINTLDCRDYLVVSSEKTSQKWVATIVGSANGSYTEHEINLSR